MHSGLGAGGAAAADGGDAATEIFGVSSSAAVTLVSLDPTAPGTATVLRGGGGSACAAM